MHSSHLHCSLQGKTAAYCTHIHNTALTRSRVHQISFHTTRGKPCGTRTFSLYPSNLTNMASVPAGSRAPWGVQCYVCNATSSYTFEQPQELDEDGQPLCPACGSDFVEMILEVSRALPARLCCVVLMGMS